MNKHEFMELHPKYIQAVIDMLTKEGYMPRVLENTQKTQQRRTVIEVNNEVYEISNDGNKTQYLFLGNLR